MEKESMRGRKTTTALLKKKTEQEENSEIVRDREKGKKGEQIKKGGEEREWFIVSVE